MLDVQRSATGDQGERRTTRRPRIRPHPERRPRPQTTTIDGDSLLADSSVPVTDAEIVEASTTVVDAGVFASNAGKVDNFERDDLPNGGPLDFEMIPSLSNGAYWEQDDCNTDTPPIGNCQGKTVRMENDGTHGAGGGTYVSAPLQSEAIARSVSGLRLRGSSASTTERRSSIRCRSRPSSS